MYTSTRPIAPVGTISNYIYIELSSIPCTYVRNNRCDNLLCLNWSVMWIVNHRHHNTMHMCMRGDSHWPRVHCIQMPRCHIEAWLKWGVNRAVDHLKRWNQRVRTRNQSLFLWGERKMQKWSVPCVGDRLCAMAPVDWGPRGWWNICMRWNAQWHNTHRCTTYTHNGAKTYG